MFSITVALFWLLLSVAFEVMGTVLLMKTNNFRHGILTSICLASYGVSFYSLSQFMSRVEPAVAYSIWSGLGIVFMTIIGGVFYKEKTSFLDKAGIASIFAGILIISM